MTDLKLIVCTAINGGIGLNNALLGKVPGDLARFKEFTKGGAVFMGSRTAASLPDRKPLPGRINYVLCRDAQSAIYASLGFVPIVAQSIRQGLYIAYKQCPYDVLWVIGGQQVYQAALPYCKTLDITLGLTLPLEADAFFPLYNLNKDFVLTSHIVKDEAVHLRYLQISPTDIDEAVIG